MKIADDGVRMYCGAKIHTYNGGFIADTADAPDLALILEGWAAEAAEDAGRALDDDQFGRAARLRGKAEGLRLAAAEIRRAAK